MAKITRPDQNIKAFGSEATGTSRTIFGGTTQSDSLDDNLTTEFFEGWNTIGVKPPRQWENGAKFTITQLIAYLFQMGIPEWNALQEFHINSKTIGSNGIIYTSLTNTNIGNNPTTDNVNWRTTEININSLTTKITPVNADELIIADSADSFAHKKVTWTNIKATLKTYFDTLYGAISSDDVTNANTYTNLTLSTSTQEGFNQAVDDAFTRKYMIVEEQKPYNQAGGDAVAGINVRKLNTVTQNNITGASLNATTGVFTLPAGTYKLRATAEASRVDAHQLLVKNITNNIVYAGIEAATTTVVANPSTVEAIFTITALTEFRLEHDCKTAQTVYGLGGFSTPTTNTYVNVFSRVSIQQLGA